jgi:hypothetical protein
MLPDVQHQLLELFADHEREEVGGWVAGLLPHAATFCSGLSVNSPWASARRAACIVSAGMGPSCMLEGKSKGDISDPVRAGSRKLATFSASG